MNAIEEQARHKVGRRSSYVWLLCRDASIAIILALATFWFALGHLSKTGVKDFYEILFAPAVNFACTGHFENLKYGTASLAPLAQFLERKREHLDCKELPEDLTPYTRPWDTVQNSTLYLIGSAGLIWRAFGVSWNALASLGAALVGALALSIYGVSRLFLGRLPALFIVAMATLSPLHISMIHALRDYSKAPFIVASIFFVGVSIFERSRTRFVLYSIIAGAVAGVGLGFRSDLILVVPFYVLATTLAFFGGPKHTFFTLLLGFVTFLFSFGLIAGPVMVSAYGRGGILGHVALLGLTTPFSDVLEISHTFYDIGHLYLDSYISTIINAYHSMKAQVPYQAFEFIGPDYNKVALQAYITYAFIFPADIFVRVFSSTLHVLNLEFGAPTRQLSIPYAPGILLFFLATAVLAIRGRLFLSTFFLFFVTFFAGSTSVQFNFRHAFYLEFVYWLSLAIIFVFLISLLSARTFRTEWQRLSAALLMPMIAAVLLVSGG